ncbi:MAG: hypothetical protein WCF19_01855 [Chlamydiales bacterium]
MNIPSITHSGLSISQSIERQQSAYDRLKQHFTETSQYLDPVPIAQSLREDLSTGEKPSIWLPRLFSQMPKPMWPRLFIYFGTDICRVSHDVCFDPHTWTQLAAETLLEVVNSTWAPSLLYQTLQKMQLLSAVIKKFSEIAPADQWIPILNAFGTSCGYEANKALKSAIAENLPQNSAQRQTFIADRLVACNNTRHGKFTDLEQNLWREPFLNNNDEKYAVITSMLKQMGVQFFGYFLNRDSHPFHESVPIREIVRVVKSHPEGKKTFQAWFTALTQIDNSDTIKLRIFQTICSSYTGSDPEEVIRLLQEPDFQNLIDPIQSWFQGDIESLTNAVFESDYYYSETALRLLRHFNEKAFYPVIVHIIRSMGNRSNFQGLRDLFAVLEKMQCKGAVIDLLRQEHLDLLASLKTYTEADGLTDAFSYYNAHQTIPLLCQLFPDWSQTLTDWALLAIQTQDNPDFPDTYRDYRHLINLYNNLAKVDLLNPWLVELRAAAGSDPKLQRELETFKSQFDQQKQQKRDV